MSWAWRAPLLAFTREHWSLLAAQNFPVPVWESEKQWHDTIYVLPTNHDGPPVWQVAGNLASPIAYAACVSTKDGILCMGGHDGQRTRDEVFALQWVNGSIRVVEYPSLPSPCAYGDAAIIGNAVYLAGGQSSGDDASVMRNLWKLELAVDPRQSLAWEQLPAWDGPARVHPITVAQENGYDECLYVISGRRKHEHGFEFLRDVWEYTPRTRQWRRRADAPQCVMAGTGLGVGQSHIVIFGGDDGALFAKTNELRDRHPGFPKQAFAFHTITNTWVSTDRRRRTRSPRRPSSGTDKW